MRRPFSSAVAAAGVAALCGCATTGSQLATQGRSDLAVVPVCCASLEKVSVIDLPREKQVVRIDKQRQAFVFDGAKSFFVAYRLPAFKASYAVVLTSRPGGLQTDSSMFMPRVALYDGSWQRTRLFTEADLRSRGTSMERTVFINAGNAAESYLVVYGADIATVKEHNVAVMSTTPIIAGPVVFYYHDGKDAKGRLHASPVGDVELETQGLASPK
jgi:hypothetical protein